MSRIRIIGGAWRSRLIDVSTVKGLRPTPDRVRETLFNWLGQDMDGLRCLDLFAGSGALGFEAASRGAASVTMIEQDPVAWAALQANAKTLQASCVQLVRGDALKFASSAVQPFDVVFLDPPYRAGWIERIVPLLPKLLTEEGRVYVEAEYKIENIDRLTRIKHGTAGQVYYHLFAASA
ncbi:16S rRNA (guanine(966)-N(2))-methyltransferase RsmD [Zoogloea dura]|uniref:16S rRNA (Guanine(966)-N(2))-methyltransferase RsmD n=1 Tax=Zoogloea dura TaxID=2728840 RepID=A0A848GGV8_9RHOO|nr:16S rRNA (guanine(966)-N(2))-methyltransferase RsmD [Zoogloea dura]NML28721.1 16S rRNA (guanine(966)-N(2))-methyltransferase RsmD [Zoogloea dura]